ncbi:MAG: SRPBCC family protein [Gammaproteobacteria bacterium]
MYQVLVEKTLDIPRKKVFDALVDFGGLDKLLPDMIGSLEVSGSGIGALRTVKMKDGKTVIERLDVAHNDCIFGYTITFNDALPIKNYCAVVTLEDDGDKTIARWGSNWETDGASADEVSTMLTDLYGTLLDGIHKIV